ncbi:MAG: SDR family oxidoreductase [Deltaproteobacteria bacterium]|nr:SDR family oxidoreductase [Deltaproteobacteria bacterium]
MKILVTGGTGFLGAHVVRLLLEEGHRVKVLLRKSSPRRLLEGMKVEEFIGDVTDRKSVFEAVRGMEIVFHVAGYISFWRGEKEIQTQVNVEGTRNIVEASLENGVGRLIHTSSIAALGRVPDGALGDETLPFDWWPYRINYNNSKYLAEKEVEKGVAQGLSAVVVNPATIFGPGEIHAHSGRLILSIKKGRVPFYVPGGCCTCDVRDVARGHLLAWKKGKVGERYILGGENFTWKEIMTVVADLVGARPPSFQLPTPLYKGMARLLEGIALFTKKRPSITTETAHYLGHCFYFSSEKAIRELGYTITPFRKTIEEAYRWFLENGYLQP